MAMACEQAAQASSKTGAARRRCLQAQRATARLAEWLPRLGRDAAVHHTAATAAPSEGVGHPRADVAQLLAVVRSLEAQLAALAAEVVWFRAVCGLLY